MLLEAVIKQHGRFAVGGHGCANLEGLIVQG